MNVAYAPPSTMALLESAELAAETLVSQDHLELEFLGAGPQGRGGRYQADYLVRVPGMQPYQVTSLVEAGTINGPVIAQKKAYISAAMSGHSRTVWHQLTENEKHVAIDLAERRALPAGDQEVDLAVQGLLHKGAVQNHPEQGLVLADPIFTAFARRVGEIRMETRQFPSWRSGPLLARFSRGRSLDEVIPDRETVTAAVETRFSGPSERPAAPAFDGLSR